MSSTLGVVAGLIAIFVVLQDAFEVMLLPRRVHRRVRLMRYYFAGAWAMWSAIGRQIGELGRRERFLSVFGALAMVVLFGIWAAVLITGFGAVEWGLETEGPPTSLLGHIYMSGVTFFTLGYGDLVPHSEAARVVAVVEAGTGIGFIAVVIGYLPVLYQLFSRREAHVIQLDARAGSPPTASTLLSRHAQAGRLDTLDELLREWEIWGSELLESHLSYPMLIYYRSQHDNQSWLAALCAVMDVCALIMVGAEEMCPFQARMTFTMARQVVVEMARSFGTEPSRYAGVDRLPHALYGEMEDILRDAGLQWSGGPDTEETLAALRATYEPLLDGLGSALLMPLPGWMPAGEASDHWQGGHRGLIATRLIEQLARRDVAARVGPVVEGKLSRRLRARLRERP